MGDKMYFYVLDGGSYDEYYKSVFYSETLYSQEEFMDIVKRAYVYCCDEISQEYEINERCEFLITAGSVLWAEKFKEHIEKISDLKLIVGDERIFVGTLTSRNKNTVDIEKSLKSSKISDCINHCRYKKDNWHKERICWYGRCEND